MALLVGFYFRKCNYSITFPVFRPPKPFQTARTCFFYPGKARQCRFSWIQVRFRPISGFWDFRFLCPGILFLEFLSFRGPGSRFESNYEQNQPSGGSTFSKTTPPWISRARRFGISKQSCKSSTACRLWLSALHTICRSVVVPVCSSA